MKRILAPLSFAITASLAGCGAEIPVEEIDYNVNQLESADWEDGVQESFSDFKEPSLSKAQEKYSSKFRLNGEFGRKLLYFTESDDKWARAIRKRPEGLFDLCPSYATLKKSDKVLVWASILDALSFSETQYSPALTYKEKFKDSTGAYVVSTGLFQLSRESSKAHGGACKSVTNDKLKDGSFNLLCAFQIMSHQILNEKVLIYDNKKVYYWSTLSRGRNPKGFARFMGRLSQLMQDEQSWPRVCGLPEKF